MMVDNASPTASLAHSQRRVPHDACRWKCDLQQFDFETTDDLPQITQYVGQERAESAIEFGIGIEREGYNLYVLGPPGSGKRSLVEKHLASRAEDQPVPPDWCYVNNFQNEDRPHAIALPAGKGRELVAATTRLVEDLKSAIPAALESDEQQRRLEQAGQEFQEEHSAALNALAEEARAKGIDLMRTPNGVALAPTRDGQVISHEVFEKLPEAERNAIESAVEELQPRLQAIMQRLPQLMKLSREKVRELNREAIRFAIEYLIAPLKAKYGDLPEVVAHFESIQSDVIDRADEFGAQQEQISALNVAESQFHPFTNYQINLVVDHSETKGAPVVYEDYPYLHKLVGRVDHLTHMGSLVTHFSLIKAGALHRANGGYLVVQARDLLMQPFAWEELKRALRSGKIQIESLGAALSLISTVSVQPEPIDLHVKVVLLGDRLLYYLLRQHDPDFNELFKVAADFDDETDRNPENCQLYATMLAALARDGKTRPLDRAAVALMIEQAARHVGDNEKLSAHMRSITDLLHESDYWAGRDNAHCITADHVHRAIDQQIYRSDRIRQHIYEDIRRGTHLIDVSGQQAGQVNGLSVISMGDFSFGRPSRITATARMGRGKLVDIEREVELGGAIHSKGVLILSSLLAARYAADQPLSLSASLVFEQSYGMVDGDSASVAEWCALISTLADVPIRQSLAITGSLNQQGQAQPIGGVNEKIEGFFDVCKTHGLTGEQGVLIPSANKKHLMLREDVVAAVKQGTFSVYSYHTVDEAIEILTGRAAGSRNQDGKFPDDSVNGLADRRLREMAERQRLLAVDSQHKSEA